MTEIPHREGDPARRAFEPAGYTTLEELLAADEGDLLILHGVGPKAIRILREEADKHQRLRAIPTPTGKPDPSNSSL